MQEIHGEGLCELCIVILSRRRAGFVISFVCILVLTGVSWLYVLLAI
jgi:hypothetical protein